MSDTWEEMLEDVRAQIRDTERLLAKFRAVEEYIAERLGKDSRDDTTKPKRTASSVRAKAFNAQDFSKLPRAVQAEKVLRHERRAMKASSIARFIQEVDLSATLHVPTLANALYTTMMRKPETFRKTSNAEWILREWERSEPDNSDSDAHQQHIQQHFPLDTEFDTSKASPVETVPDEDSN